MRRYSISNLVVKCSNFFNDNDDDHDDGGDKIHVH